METAGMPQLDQGGAREAGSQSRRQRLTVEARRWVSQTFFGTLLEQVRNSPFKSDLLSGGRGGEAFGSMLDQHLADRMARGAGEKLVRSIVRRLEDGAGHGQGAE